MAWGSRVPAQNLACSCGAVTYAYEFHFFAVTFTHAYDHVVDQRTPQAVLCAVLAVIGGTGYYYVSVLNFNAEIGMYGLFEGALGTLDCNFSPDTVTVTPAGIAMGLFLYVTCLCALFSD